MHALSRESGFAPSKEDFHRLSGASHRSVEKFFSHYTDMVARCGYKTQAEKRRAAMVQRRKAMSLAPQPGPISEQNESVFGAPLEGYPMVHAPVNEQGVVVLFALMAKKLGFVIEVVRQGFPDCEAKRQGPDEKWRRVRIEFEYLTSRFDHDPAGCDLVVCWEADKKGIGVEVIELKREVERARSVEGK